MEIVDDKRGNGARKLYRSRNAKIGGVLQGLADYLNCDVVLLRVLAVVAFFVPCIPVVLPYIIMWVVVPEEPVNQR